MRDGAHLALKVSLSLTLTLTPMNSPAKPVVGKIHSYLTNKWETTDIDHRLIMKCVFI